MTMIRSSPWQETVDRRFRRIVEDLGMAGTLPAADVYETEKDFVFEIEAPGFAEHEIAIEVSDHSLTVKGERMRKEERHDHAFQLHERMERAFERRFDLPAGADVERVSATFDKGLLEIRAAKLPSTKGRKVEIAHK